ncbi:MAG: helix-turn-helix domain-containing protein [Oscillospiraceae bacterium]|nr:helix-turn-helix domain-containing protein [Oscillospiraceae bacterium]
MPGIKVIVLLIMLIIGVSIFFCVICLGIWLLVLRICGGMKYLRSDSVRQEDMAVTRSLGETLRDHRARCQITQEYVAEAIGVSRQAVSKWEKGLSSPSMANLLALAKLYGVSVEELLRDVA